MYVVTLICVLRVSQSYERGVLDSSEFQLVSVFSVVLHHYSSQYDGFGMACLGVVGTYSAKMPTKGVLGLVPLTDYHPVKSCWCQESPERLQTITTIVSAG